MKNIRFTLFTSVLILSHFVNAQSVEHIRNSGLFNFGIGSGENYAVARKNALQNLTEGISVHIKSEFEHIVRETNGNVDDYSNSIIKTYSSAVINQYQEKVIAEKQGTVELMLYISKVDLQKVFYERELIIRDLIALGEKSERELRIGDALRNYYWAMVLTRSHPNNKNLRHDFGNNTQLSILKGLSDRIESIFTRLKFTPTSVDQKSAPAHKQINLAISFNDQPVQNLDYTYFTGDGFSGITSIRDGKGIASVDGPFAAQMQILRLKVEYQYANKAHLEPEIKQMMENVSIPYFESAEFRIALNKKTNEEVAPAKSEVANVKADAKEQTAVNVSPNTKVTTDSNVITEAKVSTDAKVTADTKLTNDIKSGLGATITPASNQAPDLKFYKSSIEKVISSVRSGNLQSTHSLFTPEGLDLFTKLIANGNVTVLNHHIDSLKFLKLKDEVVVRSVPMLFAFKNNREKFVEQVVFTFNQDKKISNIAFALGQIATNDILQKPEGFGSFEDKYFLIRFLENYKTAYSLKRLDYLQAIFDENALIIVGNRVNKVQEPTDRVQQMYGNFSNEDVEYIVLSKSEYLERLKRVFSRNEFVNIHFEDNQVRKTQRNDKVYGIQIAQHYHSSTYADKGYLFLMIDLNDSIQPKIYVRTWQPRKNADGSVIGLENFKF
ncbi:MAG: hypothetical protein RBT57_10110 [Paludibacter sp.]|jgi:hypothetical protein|nr:hypothetical protein [Paludibacter sp.]